VAPIGTGINKFFPCGEKFYSVCVEDLLKIEKDIHLPTRARRHKRKVASKYSINCCKGIFVSCLHFRMFYVSSFLCFVLIDRGDDMWIQQQRHSAMTDDHESHRHRCNRLCNTPSYWSEKGHVDHAASHGYHDKIHVHEFLGNLWDFFEEIGVFNFLFGHFPGHIVSENVGNKSFVDVEAQTVKEEAVHRLPLEILNQRTKQAPFSKSVPHNGKSNITDDPEN
jgi:hypothetical protein